MVTMERAVTVREMHVVLPRLAAPEEVAAGNLLFTPIDVPCSLQRPDCRLAFFVRPAAGENVENRLRCHPRNRRAPGMLEQQSHSFAIEKGE